MTNDIADIQHQLIFSARMNIYYHEKKERHFGLCASLVTFVSLIASSVAFATISDFVPMFYPPVSKELFGSAVMLLVAIANGLALAFQITTKHGLHMSFKKRWNEVFALADKGTAADLEQAKELQARINAEEPAPDQDALKEAYNYACDLFRVAPPSRQESTVV